MRITQVHTKRFVIASKKKNTRFKASWILGTQHLTHTANTSSSKHLTAEKKLKMRWSARVSLPLLNNLKVYNKFQIQSKTFSLSSTKLTSNSWPRRKSPSSPLAERSARLKRETVTISPTMDFLTTNSQQKSEVKARDLTKTFNRALQSFLQNSKKKKTWLWKPLELLRGHKMLKQKEYWRPTLPNTSKTGSKLYFLTNLSDLLDFIFFFMSFTFPSILKITVKKSCQRKSRKSEGIPLFCTLSSLQGSGYLTSCIRVKKNLAVHSSPTTYGSN